MRRLLRTPWLTLAWLSSAFGLCLFIRSVWPLTPLTEEAGFAAAVDFVRGRASPDDLVLIWPPEQAAALSALPPGLTATDAVPASSARSARRYLVLGPVGYSEPPELALAEREPRQRFSSVEVGVYRFDPGGGAVFDLRQELGRATVGLEGMTALVCTERYRGGVRCPGRPEWNRVTPEVLTADGEPWPAVWAHPVAGRPLVIDLGTLELSDELELEAGLADAAVTQPGATVVVRLEIDGTLVRTLTRTNERGVTRIRVPTSREAKPVRLVISTDDDGRRHLGVNLRTYETPK
jgi:hypothetical protein